MNNKQLTGFMLVSVIFISSISTYGATINDVKISSNSEDMQVVTALKEEAVTRIESMTLIEGGTSEEITFYFEEGVRVYDNKEAKELSDITSFDDISLKDIQKNFDYHLMVPAEYHGMYYELEYAVGQGIPEDRMDVLSEEIKEELLAQEGKWNVTTIYQSDEEDSLSSYLNQIPDSALNSYDHIIIMGAVKGLDKPFLIGFKNGKAEDVLSLGYPYAMIRDGVLQKPSSDAPVLGKYSDIMKIARKYYKYPGESPENPAGISIKFCKEQWEQDRKHDFFLKIGISVVCLAAVIGIGTVILIQSKKRK